MTGVAERLPAGFRDSLAGVLLLRAMAWAPRFSGRATRRELGLTVAICTAALVLLDIVTPLATEPKTNPAPGDYGNGLAAVQFLLTFGLTSIPVLAAMVRRLHDSGRDGWVLTMVLIPYMGIVFIAALMLFNPTPGPNVFGEDPRDRR